MAVSESAPHAGATRVVTVVSTAHLFSHFYQVGLPPLFPILAGVYGVSFSELGFLVTVMFAASGIAQVAAGFVVDRFGARNLLVLGAALLSGSFFLLAFFPNYWVAMGLMAVAGLGNSVFHPADFAIFQASVREDYLGRAYGWHGFAGNVGYMAAPLIMAAMAVAFGWQIAVALAGGAGLLTVIALIVLRNLLLDDTGAADKVSARLPLFDLKNAGFLLSPAILSCFVFFLMIAITLLAFTTYSVIVFTTYYSLPFLVANTLLTVFLSGYVLGIVPGGSIADQIKSHDKLTAAGFVGGGAIILAFSFVPVSMMMFDTGATLGWFGPVRVDVVLVGFILFSAGAAFGVVMPSRDMIVRKVAPEGSTGRVFGFVYSALDLGGAIAPAAFGWIIAIGQPHWMFRVVAIAMTIAGLSALLARILPKPVTLAAE